MDIDVLSKKVILIDRKGNFIMRGNVNVGKQHSDYLLDIADELFPGNSLRNQHDFPCNPLVCSYFFYLMGYVAILNNPSYKRDEAKFPDYLIVTAPDDLTPPQEEGLYNILGDFATYKIYYQYAIDGSVRVFEEKMGHWNNENDKTTPQNLFKRNRILGEVTRESEKKDR